MDVSVSREAAGCVTAGAAASIQFPFGAYYTWWSHGKVRPILGMPKAASADYGTPGAGAHIQRSAAYETYLPQIKQISHKK